jgi:hypothetical protein
MFNSIRGAGAGRVPGHPRTVSLWGFVLAFFFCAVLWAAACYDFGYYFGRVHTSGSRLYRINSYEQFIKEKAGDGAFLLA